MPFLRITAVLYRKGYVMIIQSSSVNMRSNRRYATSSGFASRTTTRGLGFQQSGKLSFSGSSIGGQATNTSGNGIAENLAGNTATAKNTFKTGGGASERLWLDVSGWNFRNRLTQTNGTQQVSDSEQARSMAKIQEDSFHWLLDLLFGRTSGSGRTVVNTSSAYGNAMDLRVDSFSIPSFGLQVTETEMAAYYQEEETTNFATTGTVVTADGRELSFNLEASMSRSFTEAVYSRTQSLNSTVFCDPLVINLDTNIAEVSDQKFYFDIDADGHKEAISQLGPGSGFLALDKNGDGVINDGNELFGTQNGDGFADLAKYDSDGNGWIDEADDIFDKLVIWTKDANGNDVLCGLGKAGVGAIYLGNVNTEFSMNSKEDNTVNARVRKTGIFLYENGGTGTVQHVDFAK